MILQFRPSYSLADDQFTDASHQTDSLKYYINSKNTGDRDLNEIAESLNFDSTSNVHIRKFCILAEQLFSDSAKRQEVLDVVGTCLSTCNELSRKYLLSKLKSVIMASPSSQLANMVEFSSTAQTSIDPSFEDFFDYSAYLKTRIPSFPYDLKHLKLSFGDKKKISFVSAYLNLPIKELLEYLLFTDPQQQFSEKISLLVQLKPDNILNINGNKKFYSILSTLIIITIEDRQNSPSEKLLIIAKALSLTLKQVFGGCVNFLFPKLVILSGKFIRCKIDYKELEEYWSFFAEDIYETQSIILISSFLKRIAENKDNSLTSEMIDLIYGCCVLVKYSSDRQISSTLRQMALFYDRIQQEYQEAASHTLCALEAVIAESIFSDKDLLLANLLQIALNLGFFTAISSNIPQIKVKFSTLGSLPLFELLCIPLGSSDQCGNEELLISSMRVSIDIINDLKSPLRRLAISGLEKNFTIYSSRAEAVLVDKIKLLVRHELSLPSLFPLYQEFQSILGLNSFSLSARRRNEVDFVSELFLRQNRAGCISDLFLVYVSGLLERTEYQQQLNLTKAFEYCSRRLVFLAKNQSSSIISAYTEELSNLSVDNEEWSRIIASFTEIAAPTSFSEWLFSVWSKSCDFCPPREKEIFRAIIPAMIDPTLLLPLFHILLFSAFLSSNGQFFHTFFKSEIFKAVELASGSANIFKTVLDLLSEFLGLFIRLGSSSGLDPAGPPNWITLFSIDELMLFFRKSVELNVQEYATFFMQMIWSTDCKKLSGSEIYQTFSRVEDYSSALCVFSDDDKFGIERSIYHFMSSKQNNLAESAMKMISSENIQKFDLIFLRNNAARMDSQLLHHHFQKFSRLLPERLEHYWDLLGSFGFMGKELDSFSTDKSLFYDRTGSSEVSILSDSNWSNFKLLGEAKKLRKLKDFENSYYTLSKMRVGDDGFWNFKHFFELGNWFESTGCHRIAIEIFNSLVKEQKTPKLLAKIYRKLAVTMRYSRHYSDQEIIDIFEKSVNFDRSSAKTAFEIANFYDSDSKSAVNIDKSPIILKNLARALLQSRKFDYLAYPRLITIWLNSPQNGSAADKKISELMSKFINMASTAQAVNHLSQLISRIGHPAASEVASIENLLARIFADYPDAVLWKVSSVSNSMNEVRKARVQSFLAKLKCREKLSNIKNFLEFCNVLTTICDLPVPADSMKLIISKELRTCKRILSEGASIAAPNSALVYFPENRQDYEYIGGFEDNCLALPSLQRPKKIRLTLNNSRLMTALLKPKDDLRKDCRFMELCRFLNTNFLMTKTRFAIKTFAVTPLNDECGIIEWVENTASFRSILLKSYKRLGTSVATRDLKDILAMQISPHEKFTKFFLPKFPPIFFRWFFERFPSVENWNTAMMCYTDSLAVMSVVGFIMGLGDRHGENILFDEVTGNCVHVDFNCLFEKGKTLEYPEKVPFRLTQNLVHAFGAAGINSKFKASSLAVMNSLWESKRGILTNLETFLHDPLVEWSKAKRSVSVSSDITNEQASKILKIVERKLSGYIEQENFSCEGQVEKLIQHATDKKNLSEMYIGWSPFL